MRGFIIFSILLTNAFLSEVANGDHPVREIPVTGKSIETLAGLDDAILGLIDKHDLPGISIAISENGRLIHSRGYGYANRDAAEAVLPSSRFRIASISKPITAVAILRLVDLGKLQLDDRVFDILDAPESVENSPPPDRRLKDVTIKHLLQHRGGWDRDKSFDPMFRSVHWAQLCNCEPPAMPKEVIRGMQSQPLDFDPGKQYAYSNYGYCLLGRVIEKLSGQDYDVFVQTQIFQPLDIKSITLGKTRLAGRQANEVQYYHPGEGKSVFAGDLDQFVPIPYGTWCLEAMDAHGGWIATAEDLVRFIDAIGLEPKAAKDKLSWVLRPETIGSMLLRPDGEQGDKDSYYGLGFTIRPGKDGFHTVWHNGSLPGTSTELTRRSDGRSFAVLINSRHSVGGTNPLNDVTRAIHRALAELGESSVVSIPQ